MVTLTLPSPAFNLLYKISQGGRERGRVGGRERVKESQGTMEQAQARSDVYGMIYSESPLVEGLPTSHKSQVKHKEDTQNFIVMRAKCWGL